MHRMQKHRKDATVQYVFGHVTRDNNRVGGKLFRMMNGIGPFIISVFLWSYLLFEKKGSTNLQLTQMKDLYIVTFSIWTFTRFNTRCHEFIGDLVKIVWIPMSQKLLFFFKFQWNIDFITNFYINVYFCGVIMLRRFIITLPFFTLLYKKKH